jgi:hypothetical protein
MRTASARESATIDFRHDDEAWEYQVEFLYRRRPVVLEARGKYCLWHQSFKDDASKEFIRECLQRVPRHTYELLYLDVFDHLKVTPREGRLSRIKFTKCVREPEFIPYSFDWKRACTFRVPVRQAMLLPDGRHLHAATEEARSLRIRRSRVGASAREILTKFKGSWRLYVNTTVKDGRRGRVIYSIARNMADQGATADEIETVVRSSRAFQSKAGPFSKGGQGRRWGEQEIERMRKLAR